MTTKRTVQLLKNYFWHLPKSIFFNLYYRFPSRKLTIIGVTGTDGKTTTCHLLHQVLQNAGLNAKVISTITSPGLHTTSPDSGEIQKILRNYVDSGVTHVVLEVTAHAIDQFRFFGCQFAIGLLTNTSHEHLDDFLTLDSYIKTKAKLLKLSKIAITNIDDPSCPIVSSLINSQLLTYGYGKSATYRISGVSLTSNTLSFAINNIIFLTNSAYEYQAYNITAAFAVIDKLHLDHHLFRKAIKLFPEVTGRRQEVDNNLGIKTIIDFGHTPKALTDTLMTLKKRTSGRLIVIFGATGGRDQTKRPLMGKTVSEHADIAIITADDTRHEKIDYINSQIIKGFDPTRSIDLSKQQSSLPRLKSDKFIYYNIPNRQDAFNLAIKISRPGDTVVAFGKGHETTILHGSTEFPWSESQAFRTAFNFKKNANAQTTI
ncbi:MAG: UDP-N-acetylmuramyl-tripeptide synthetase [Candidatus Shapirobacteria bacterium]|jgi:UDP-N-acetylmuramoyl-L-alanyl-D-glutamate--2,6-diaminopimelate ligase